MMQLGNLDMKPTLLGRKRIQDANHAKEALLAMKEEGNKVSEVSFEDQAFQYLLEFHQALKNPQHSLRLSANPLEQHRKLLEALEKIANTYGKQQTQQGKSLSESKALTQKLMDALVLRLNKAGINLRRIALN